jgi:putative tricarboxylic transport membrane protein
MERYDRWLSLIWMALGLGQCIESWRLGVGSFSEPESGFMPFVLGLGIIALSTILWVESFLSLKRMPGQKSSTWAEADWRRILWVSLLLLGYALLLPKLGYLLATFLLTVFLLKSGEPMKWPASLLIGLLTSGLTYWIFGVWLSVPFPRGFLSF